MTPEIFATIAPTGITIRAALPGDPFSAALLWMRSVMDGATMPEEPAE